MARSAGVSLHPLQSSLTALQAGSAAAARPPPRPLPALSEGFPPPPVLPSVPSPSLSSSSLWLALVSALLLPRLPLEPPSLSPSLQELSSSAHWSKAPGLSARSG
jgi:hypothetical protein